MPLGNYSKLLWFCLALVNLIARSGVGSPGSSLVKNQVGSFLSILPREGTSVSQTFQNHPTVPRLAILAN